ncbi:MAG: ATP-binding cassette domain-containing protein [Chitinophagaceae bacterium]|nr:ATP-binding cassette domain-containing protein [Chitinophagaceae bacterium]
MQLVLKNIDPDYISDTSHSDIWNKEITVTKGEHVHIIAPSGSGKTSLIHFIYGLRTDYKGSIVHDGKNIKNLRAEKKASIRQNSMSIIFQDLRLFDDHTALENIEVKRKLNPFHPPEMIYEMATRMGVANKLPQVIKTCSYGEQQRIAIIRSLMQPFDFLLLDEPFSHLDEENRTKAMELLLEECEKRKAAMIFADLKELDMLKNEKILHL